MKSFACQCSFLHVAYIIFGGLQSWYGRIDANIKQLLQREKTETKRKSLNIQQHYLLHNIDFLSGNAPQLRNGHSSDIKQLCIQYIKHVKCKSKADIKLKSPILGK